MSKSDTVAKSVVARKADPKYVACDVCRLSPICSPVNVGGHTYDFTGKMVIRRHYFKKGEIIFHQGEQATLILPFLRAH